MVNSVPTFLQSLLSKTLVCHKHQILVSALKVELQEQDRPPLVYGVSWFPVYSLTLE